MEKPAVCDRCRGTGTVNGIGEWNGMPEFRSWPCERCRPDPDLTRKMLEGDFELKPFSVKP